jgi:hypothetical protein
MSSLTPGTLPRFMSHYLATLQPDSPEIKFKEDMSMSMIDTCMCFALQSGSNVRPASRKSTRLFLRCLSIQAKDPASSIYTPQDYAEIHWIAGRVGAPFFQNGPHHFGRQLDPRCNLGSFGTIPGLPCIALQLVDPRQLHGLTLLESRYRGFAPFTSQCLQIPPHGFWP